MPWWRVEARRKFYVLAGPRPVATRIMRAGVQNFFMRALSEKSWAAGASVRRAGRLLQSADFDLFSPTTFWVIRKRLPARCLQRQQHAGFASPSRAQKRGQETDLGPREKRRCS